MMNFGLFRYKTLLCVIMLTLFSGGCVSGIKLEEIPPLDPNKIYAPVGTKFMDKEQVDEIISAANKRNVEVEDTPDWIKRSYAGLIVRKITNLSEFEYEKYKKYLDNGSVYILVHPGFFPFFHYPKKLINNTAEKISEQNVVDELLALPPSDYEFAVLQAQERRMRDFIEFKSAQNKLLLIIIPRNYNTYTGYTYKRGRDEYMRYLNEITNFSESVLFVESRSPNRGYLTEEDALRLMEFLVSIKAKTIYVGGGYVGRCLEDFYALLTEEFGREGIYVVPELSDISPRELNKSLARAILAADGSISIELATSIMQRDVYRVQEILPDIKNLE